MAWRRSRVTKRVKRRVIVREKREMVARLEQDKFESVREQYGCVHVSIQDVCARGANLDFCHITVASVASLLLDLHQDVWCLPGLLIS